MRSRLRAAQTVAQVSVVVLSDLLWNLGCEGWAARLTILERRFLR